MGYEDLIAGANPSAPRRWGEAVKILPLYCINGRTCFVMREFMVSRLPLESLWVWAWVKNRFFLWLTPFPSFLNFSFSGSNSLFAFQTGSEHDTVGWLLCPTMGHGIELRLFCKSPVTQHLELAVVSSCGESDSTTSADWKRMRIAICRQRVPTTSGHSCEPQINNYQRKRPPRESSNVHVLNLTFFNSHTT